MPWDKIRRVSKYNIISVLLGAAEITMEASTPLMPVPLAKGGMKQRLRRPYMPDPISLWKFLHNAKLTKDQAREILETLH